MFQKSWHTGKKHQNKKFSELYIKSLYCPCTQEGKAPWFITLHNAWFPFCALVFVPITTGH